MVDSYTHERKTNSAYSAFGQHRPNSAGTASNVSASGHDAPRQTRGTRELPVQRSGMNANSGIGHIARVHAMDPPTKSESESHTFTLVPIPTIVDPGSGHLVRHETVSIGIEQGYLYKLNYFDPKSEPGDLIPMLCRWSVWAFSFREKQWNVYHVNELEDVDYRKKSFDRLVLDVEYKAILKAIVAQHIAQGQSRFKDLVAGKGQGLVILLHGKYISIPNEYVSILLFRAPWGGQDPNSRV